MANSIASLPSFLSGGVADSGIRRYQFVLTCSRTFWTYGPKLTSCVSVGISIAPKVLDSIVGGMCILRCRETGEKQQSNHDLSYRRGVH